MQKRTTSPKSTGAGNQAVLEARRRQIIDSIRESLVLIPAGTFMMGSEKSEIEKPVHQVTIREAFYMGRYEVTQAQWQAVMEKKPLNFNEDSLPAPVSWTDAQEFIRRLNARGDGYVYRLPSEAEWEYACRAGTTTEFAFGDSISSDQANFVGDYPYGGAPKGIFRQKTTPVGSFQPNAFGLYDMHGNLWEWCSDVWHENYKGAPTDGSAWLTGGDSSLRILRGGSWQNNGLNLRSAFRYKFVPDQADYVFGLRLAASRR